MEIVVHSDTNWWLVGGQLATPLVVALIAAYFAWQQSMTAKRKLRLDHFDKRFAVFNAARDFIGKALVTNTVDLPGQNAYIAATLGASFLLSDDLAKNLDEILRRAIDLSFLEKELENAPSEEHREKTKQKFLADRNWLRDQFNVLEEKFKPFLRLEG